MLVAHSRAAEALNKAIEEHNTEKIRLLMRNSFDLFDHLVAIALREGEQLNLWDSETELITYQDLRDAFVNNGKLRDWFKTVVRELEELVSEEDA
jgi:hypothetical protein